MRYGSRGTDCQLDARLLTLLIAEETGKLREEMACLREALFAPVPLPPARDRDPRGDDSSQSAPRDVDREW